jgi:hypothetical protein
MAFQIGFGIPTFEVKDGFVIAVFLVDSAFFAAGLGLRGALDRTENGQQVAPLVSRRKKPYGRNHHGVIYLRESCQLEEEVKGSRYNIDEHGVRAEGWSWKSRGVRWV